MSLHDRLSSIPPGLTGWSEFESCTELILENALFPDFIDKPIIQEVSPYPDQRRDIILPIKHTSPMWHYWAVVYGSDLLMVECKNYRDSITQAEVETTAKYLRRPSLAKLAFIISRTDPEPAAFDAAVDIFRTEKKLIIFLALDDLHSLIDHDGNPVDATDHLRKKYQLQKARM